MADLDIDPFSKHDEMDAQPYQMGETIPFIQEGVG